MTNRDFGARRAINPKHEILNPKQIQNANVRMFKTAIVILLQATTLRAAYPLVSFEFLSF